MGPTKQGTIWRSVVHGLSLPRAHIQGSNKKDRDWPSVVSSVKEGSGWPRAFKVRWNITERDYFS